MGLNAGIEKSAQRLIIGAGMRHGCEKADIEGKRMIAEELIRKEFVILRAITMDICW
jgi:hypothetical protein